MFLSFINHNYEKQNKWIKFSEGFLLLCKSSIKAGFLENKGFSLVFSKGP